MRIKFELINEQVIKIIGEERGEEKEIGIIFTPSSSGGSIINAIQICGAEEVFDYWGCARYIKPKEGIKGQILNTLENKKIDYEQMKDIQIMFSFDSEPSAHTKKDIDFDKDCESCFNHPCTCENKVTGEDKSLNPFNIKREWDMEDKLQYTSDHTPLKEQEKLLVSNLKHEKEKTAKNHKM